MYVDVRARAHAQNPAQKLRKNYAKISSVPVVLSHTRHAQHKKQLDRESRQASTIQPPSRHQHVRTDRSTRDRRPRFQAEMHRLGEREPSLQVAHDGCLRSHDLFRPPPNPTPRSIPGGIFSVHQEHAFFSTRIGMYIEQRASTAPRLLSPWPACLGSNHATTKLCRRRSSNTSNHDECPQNHTPRRSRSRDGWTPTT